MMTLDKWIKEKLKLWIEKKIKNKNENFIEKNKQKEQQKMHKYNSPWKLLS